MTVTAQEKTNDMGRLKSIAYTFGGKVYAEMDNRSVQIEELINKKFDNAVRYSWNGLIGGIEKTAIYANHGLKEGSIFWYRGTNNIDKSVICGTARLIEEYPLEIAGGGLSAYGAYIYLMPNTTQIGEALAPHTSTLQGIIDSDLSGYTKGVIYSSALLAFLAGSIVTNKLIRARVKKALKSLNGP